MRLVSKGAMLSLILISVFLVMPGAVTFAGDAITITSFGGAYTKSQLEAHYKPFSEKFGITVNSVDYNGGIAQIRAQV
ncbi:MAG: hypothetical protein PVI06_16265, partial [Desulfobacterales bacterium]